jgi:hypothetical protein
VFISINSYAARRLPFLESLNCSFAGLRQTNSLACFARNGYFGGRSGLLDDVQELESMEYVRLSEGKMFSCP